MTFISRILGFLRDMVFARAFGAGYAMDAFFVAFRIPNFLRRLSAEGAFSQAFVPVLSEYKTQRDRAEVQALVDRVGGTLAGVLLLVALAGAAASPVLVMMFAPGFIHEPQKFGLTAHMVRITFPYILFISLAAFASGILNSYGRFGAPAFTPVLLNLALIGAALLVAPLLPLHQQPMALAWGVAFGGLLQFAYLFAALRRLGVYPRLRWGWGDPGVRRILKLMGPVVFGSSVTQISLLIDTVIASFLITGSVSWLYYSDRLVEFPLGVFGIALSTVILPSLSGSHARRSPEEFNATLDWALRWVLILGIPAALGLLLLAGPLLSTLFQHGRFTAADVAMARLSLMAFSVGLPGFILVKVLLPAFYSRQDTRTPARIALVAVSANITMNLLFVVPMVKLGVPGPHAGLALATSLAAYVNAGLLYRRLRRTDAYRPQPGWGRLLARVGIAAAVLIVVLGLGVRPLDVWAGRGIVLRAAFLAGWVALGALAYLGTLRLLGMRFGIFRARPAAEAGE